MMLHPTTFDWNWQSTIYEDTHDWEFLDQLPRRGIGRLCFATSGDKHLGFFLIYQEDLDTLEEDYQNTKDMHPEDVELKPMIDAMVAYAKAHPNEHDEFLFVFDMS